MEAYRCRRVSPPLAQATHNLLPLHQKVLQFTSRQRQTRISGFRTAWMDITSHGGMNERRKEYPDARTEELGSSWHSWLQRNIGPLSVEGALKEFRLPWFSRTLAIRVDFSFQLNYSVLRSYMDWCCLNAHMYEQEHTHTDHPHSRLCIYIHVACILSMHASFIYVYVHSSVYIPRLGLMYSVYILCSVAQF